MRPVSIYCRTTSPGHNKVTLRAITESGDEAMRVIAPIAKMCFSLPVMIVRTVMGLLSRPMGVSSGFLLTPLLMFIGIPPALAAASGSAGIAATVERLKELRDRFRKKPVDGRVLSSGAERP